MGSETAPTIDQLHTTLVIPTDAPVVRGPRQGHWTYADWERLPHADGSRYEIIDGVLYMTTAPSYFHQWILLMLAEYIAIPARQQQLAYGIFAPVGVLMPGCDPVQPDFVVVRRERVAIIHDRRIRGVPDAIVEVLSPSNAAYDTATKYTAYATAGVPEYGIVDPARRTVQHFRLTAPGHYDPPQTYTAADQFALACLPTLAVRVADLFAGAPDTSL
ncbi:MAG: Uma2 family endonuclease [Chloroflexaceae bacterium]|nr:Uma2 family endonuclease [Chloroflexaceae bacterium]